MNNKKDGNARLSALSMLSSVLDDGQSLGDSDDGGSSLSPRDRAFARHLAYGVLRWLSALEWLAAGLLKKPLKQKDRDIQRLILLGLFQLWKDGSAPHAAINESSECARKIGKTWAVGLVNAVLRRFQREQDQRLGKLEKVDERYAHPGWLLQAIREDWPDSWMDIADSNNRQAPLWLRLNRSHDAQSTVKALREADLDVTHHDVLADAVCIEPARNMEQLPGFSGGLFSVQDPAAQLAAELLQLGPGQRVLDACAAPGGKTCHMLELEQDIRVTALDRSAQRLQKVQDNLLRLGFAEDPRITLKAADATEPASWWDGELYDRILLDAPCTATGVIRRHPEIKWLRSPSQVGEASELQASLLEHLWPLLAPGGILLYATCSVLNIENGRQINAFLENHADSSCTAMDVPWGREAHPGRQILPGENDMDGFYYAQLRKHS